MYSLAAKVIEEKDSETIVVQFRDKTTVVAKKDSSLKVAPNDYVSIIRPGEHYEVCGGKFTMECAWEL